MAVEDRQASIIDATIPLLLEFGGDVTSRQIAEAAGIAEGTVFRAFGDKESLIAAAVDRFLDPELLRSQLRSIDHALPLEDKLRLIFTLMKARFTGVVSMMSALGQTGPPPRRANREEFSTIIGEILADNLDELNVDAEKVANYSRILAFASAIPRLNESAEFTVDELVHLFMHGVAGRPVR